LNRRITSAGWLPLPEVTVAVLPAESVTVSVTDSGCRTPSSVLLGPPHVYEMLNVGLALSCVRVITVPSVHCAVHAKETSPFVPSGIDVDRRVHVVAVLLVMRHSVVAFTDTAGSNSWKLAAIPVPVCETVTVCPAIVSVPERAVPSLAATVAVTVPLPVPEAPAVTVMNAALLVAVQAHALPPVTVIATAPPLLLTVAAAGDTVKAHADPVRNVSVAE
jgi:hypothetical protein